MLKIAKLSTSPDSFRWEFPPPGNFNVKHWLRTKYWVYDADNCGDETTFWVVVIDGKPRFYKMEHSWWIDCSKDFNIENEFEIDEIDKKDIDIYATRNLRFIV